MSTGLDNPVSNPRSFIVSPRLVSGIVIALMLSYCQPALDVFLTENWPLVVVVVSPLSAELTTHGKQQKVTK